MVLIDSQFLFGFDFSLIFDSVYGAIYYASPMDRKELNVYEIFLHVNLRVECVYHETN